MGILSALPIVGKIVEKGASIIDKSILDKDQAAQLKHDFEMEVLKMDLSVVTEQSSVIQAEAKGESFLQRNWRPITMLIFVYIIFNNYVLAPYVRMFYSEFPMLPIPEQLWNLLTLGIGGYIAGRSVEKTAGSIIKTVSKKDK